MEEREMKNTTELGGKENDNVKKTEKKVKKRQKKVLGELQKQIEFYFSEPNLQKDRFLRQKIADHPDGCVEVATIASFNRMKDLTDDVSLIVKAMKLCSSVEVIDDQWIKPLQPLPEQKNVDSVTVYVEHLPRYADHTWIKKVFSACGNVVYVSLPRFKSTRDIKGFAFVEFEKEDEAEAALQMFQEKAKEDEEEESDSRENVESVKDKEENKVGKAVKQNRKRRGKLSESESEETGGKDKNLKRHRDPDSTKRICEEMDTSKKRKCALEEGLGRDDRKKAKRRSKECFVESADDEGGVLGKKEDAEGEKEVGKKKKERGKLEDKVNSDIEETFEGRKNKKRQLKMSGHSDDNDEPCPSRKRKKQVLESGDTSSDACTSSKQNIEFNDVKEDNKTVGEEMADEEVDEKKKKRKRKKREKTKASIPRLRVISKVEWVRLKKEYQKLQRESMKEAKAKLKQESRIQVENDRKPSQAETVTVLCQSTNDPENFEANGVKVKEEASKLPQKLEMQAGVVLKFFSERKSDKKQVRVRKSGAGAA